MSIFSGAPLFLDVSNPKFLTLEESLAFGLHRGGRVLLGDEMGLGKTLQVRSRESLLGENGATMMSMKSVNYCVCIYIYTHDSDTTVTAKNSE